MTTPSKIIRKTGPGPVPLSAGQTMMWILNKLDPKDPSTRRPLGLRLLGELNLHALERSLTEIVRRHEILRSVFPEIEGQPVQIAVPPQAVTVEIKDLQSLAVDRREIHARELAIQETRKEFDLANGPVFRAVLMRLQSEDHVLLILMHHIVFDGWSENIFLDELKMIYQAFSSGTTPSVPEPPVQYADFALWQRDRSSDQDLDRQMAYWKRQLQGLTSLALNTDYPRSEAVGNESARQSIVLSPVLLEQIKDLARSQQATVFMVLLAALQVLLSRYTDQEDIAVGVPVAGRTQLETERTIGCFMNVLVFRASISRNLAFKAAFNRVRDVALEAYANQEVPFEKIVEELKPERAPNRWPLFQVMFNLRNLPRSEMARAGNLLIGRFPFDVGAMGGVDLNLDISEHAVGLVCNLNYASALFRPETITRMLGHFQTLLEGITANPDQRLSELPILTEIERQSLVKWNDTKRDYPSNECVHELFEDQVKRTPDAVAVVFEDENLTYREVNRRANQLAHYLIRLGIGPETLVGICVERSPEMIVGLLAILKAGGAYVPLDPAYPEERMVFLLEDAQVPVLITRCRPSENLQAYKSQVICLESDWNIIAQETDENPVRRALPANVAYVMYTSGSTGKPKGTMIEHKNLVNYLCWVNDCLLGDTTRVLPLVTQLTFDACLKQLFAPLLRGREVWILPGSFMSEPVTLLTALSTQTRVGLNCVPSLWKAILDTIESGQSLPLTENLSSLFIGGEQLSKELVSKSLRVLPNLQIWNLYGLTEATANSTVARIVSEYNITTGRPISNTQVHILDPQLHPVPIGVLGELYIGGSGLARGYLECADLTAEKFIPNSLTDELGARLFKTGDFGRYLLNGDINLVGRLDHQVKIRGFRVELGEIEAVLLHQPTVRQTVVLARDDHGEMRLVAYLVRNQESAPKISDLRSFLQQKLPEYMVPSAFVFLDALPLTPNGKVDRRALPVPEQTRPELEARFVAPQTEVERTIATIWRNLLKIESIGLEDNFFDLGGHSLLAIQVQNKLKNVLGREVPAIVIFEHPTVRSLARYLSEGTETQLSRQGTHEPGTTDRKTRIAQQRQHRQQAFKV